MIRGLEMNGASQVKPHQGSEVGYIKSQISDLKSPTEPLPLPSFHQQWEVVFSLRIK